MKRVLALTIALMMVLTSSALAFNQDGGKYYADYSSMEQAQAERPSLAKNWAKRARCCSRTTAACP